LRRVAEAFDAYIAPLSAAEQLSGQLLVAQDDQAVLERCYGWANRELQSPVTAETCFNIASITKPLTQVLALQLILEGKLAATDSVGRWIPGFPAGNTMTVSHLLQHRAGIPHRFTTDEQETVPHTAAEMVEFARHATLEFPPGERSQYSSGNYIVLARILELASGSSYPELLQQRIAGPLGLRHTAHTDGRALLPGRATSYVPGIYGMENAPLKDNSFLVGAGSVWSTARDLHRVLRAVAQGALGPDVRANLLRDGKLRWNGSTNGFRALAEYDTATAISLVFVGNYHTGAVDRLSGGLRALLAGQTPAPATPPR
jgi:CubicO group peptidase (beta-lactamase class C family)